ncbi:response regulator transcription factor [Spirochaeta dissipatitropha]
MTGTLEKDGYIVTAASSAESAYSRLKNERFDLVLLDLILGDSHGLDILRLIRRQDEFIPVIIVSSCMDTSIKVNGFEIGCDDYLTKPFYSEELLSRVKRQLKRQSAFSNTKRETFIDDSISIGNLTLNLRSNELLKDGKPIEIRRKLFELLLYFIQNKNQTLTKESILNHCWDDHEDGSNNTLYVHIRQLRSLIEDDAANPELIKTVRGIGFRFTTA